MHNWKTAVQSWRPPEDWERVATIDAHTAGEPLRIFVDGFPEPAGHSVLERRLDATKRLEFYRTATMWEPRGHADMYGCLIIPPERPKSDFGVLFLHNEGYSSMCGHGIIAVATVAVEVGWITSAESTIGPDVEINIDAPAGLIKATVHRENEDIIGVSFENVPSFVAALDQQVFVEGLGTVRYDLAFGGAYYVFVDADELGISMQPENQAQLVDYGRRIKHAVSNSTEINHPLHEDLSFLYGTIFTGAPQDPNHHSRNVCIFADGEVDRSPTGTGVSARVAILTARNELQPNEKITIESILGTCFEVEVIGESICGDHPSVIPLVRGNAFITGRHDFLIDPLDNLKNGFFLR
ncbi:MAG: proline racemase family protein [Pirellulales bacterium]